jgi:hypothetical protein
MTAVEDDERGCALPGTPVVVEQELRHTQPGMVAADATAKSEPMVYEAYHIHDVPLVEVYVDKTKAPAEETNPLKTIRGMDGEGRATDGRRRKHIIPRLIPEIPGCKGYVIVFLTACAVVSMVSTCMALWLL